MRESAYSAIEHIASSISTPVVQDSKPSGITGFQLIESLIGAGLTNYQLPLTKSWRRL
jgi:hypothetical protein